MVEHLFEKVDVLLTPAALGPAPDPGTTGNPAFNSPWSLLGLPTITFPVALSSHARADSNRSSHCPSVFAANTQILSPPAPGGPPGLFA